MNKIAAKINSQNRKKTKFNSFKPENCFRKIKTFIFLTFFFLCQTITIYANDAILKRVSEDDKKINEILNRYDKKIYFTQNKGQWPEDVLYKVDFKFGQAIATSKGMLVGTYDPESINKIYDRSDREENAMHNGKPFNEPKLTLKGHNWLMNFVNALPSMKIETKEGHKDEFNYFMERDPSKFVSGASNFQEVWYKNVYEKVDVRYYPSSDGQLEYDIICKPGFNKNNIAVQFDGIEKLTVSNNGVLTLKTSVGDVAFPKPYVYQNINGNKIEVDAKYIVDGENVLKFEIGNYDAAQPLIIDPIALRWATWLTNNSAGDNHGHGVWVDETDGAIYTLARIIGSGLITTVGAYQTSSAGNLDIVLGKYLEPTAVNQSGTRVWQTYLGGSADDNPYAMEMSVDGNIYITGYTFSSNFPLLGGSAFSGSSIDNRNQSTSNIFVTKINKAGNSIKSAVIGGNGASEESYDLRTTANGEVIVCGQTNSTNLATLYPGTGASNTNNGGTDVLVFKVNKDLSAISWMKNYGGSGNDRANIMLNNSSNGDIFVAGQTSSTNFPLLNARQTSRGGTQAGFLQKLNSTGTTLWSSYFSSASNQTATILCMEFNTTKTKLYFGGLTSGLNSSNISASSVYDNSQNGGNDFFVCRMDTSQLFNVSTYLGGTSSEDNMMGLNTDANNDVYIFGYTPSTNFPVTADALQSTNQGSSDKTFTKLSTDLNTLLFSTYYGGSSNDYDPVGERGIKFSNCRIYTLVTATSNNIPLTLNALTTNKISSTSIYEPGLVIWANPPDLFGNSITPSQNICIGATPSNLTGSVPSYSLPTLTRNGTTSAYPPITTPITYQWQISTDSINWTNISGATSQNLAGSAIGPVFQNTFIRRIIGGDACVVSGPSDQIISLKIIDIQGAITHINCSGNNSGAINITPVNGTPAYTFLWSDGPTTQNRTGLTAGTYSVTVTDSKGCSATKSFTVTNLSIKPEVTALALPATICKGQSSQLYFNPNSGLTVVGWFNGCSATGTNLGTSLILPVTPIVTSTYSVVVQSNTNCRDTACVTVNVESTPPVITCPPPKTINSNESSLPANTGTATATDNSTLTANIIITYSDFSNVNPCSGTGTINRKWYAADECGFKDSCIQIITVQDTTQHNNTGTLPRDTTVNCNAVPPADTITATDNCSQPTVTFTETRTNGNCSNNYILTRTWTARDACNNTSVHVQTVTVQDTSKPVFVGNLPGNITVNCDAVPVVPTLSASDNCGQATVSFNETRANGNCINRYVLTRKWTAVDACGNNSIYTQTINVVDQTPPVISGTPSNTTVSCSSAVPPSSINSVSATDNCGGIVTVTVADVISNQTCANRYTITRTWTATDVCGNSSISSQTITVNDQTPPVITGTPANTTVSCSSAVPQSSIASVSATDNCGGIVTVTVADVISNQTCANRYTITRTWTATDVCGNSSTSSQIITVNDQTPPVITGTPTNTTVSCSSAVPQSSIGSVSATDNCGGTVTVTVADVITNQTCANRYNITRTWTATDICGNSSTSSQIITVNDQTPPVITGTPSNTTVSCSSAVPQSSIASVSATDNCSGTVTVIVADVISNQSCANRYTITRTWTATDVCGNSSTSSQTITVNDQTPPVITGTPTNTTVSCSSAVPQSSIASVSATDNCSGTVTVTVADVISNQTCTNKYTITRTWTATDVCGNSSTSSQTITVNDNINPTFNGQLPGDITVNCNSIPNPVTLTASDNCGQATVSFSESSTPGGCSGAGGIIRTWTATDACNNTTTHIQHVTVQDTTRPVISGTPQNINVNCSADVPVASNTTVSATDNCAGIVYITVADVISNQTCANRYTITRTWTATDACSNSSTSSQTIIVNDQTPSTITGTPANTTVSCVEEVPQASITSVTTNDNCAGNVTVTVADVISNQTCANRYTIRRTWTATDVCGNSSTSSQTITVNDQTPPAITNTPINTTVSCTADVPQASITSVTANDNCAGNVTVTVADVISNQTCANRYTITRTWTATDVCGNSSTSSQTITVNDQIPPTITGTPANTTVSCVEDVPQASITSVTATDNCAGNLTVTVADVISNQTCANRYSITRTWTAIDVCGNSSESTQTIIVNDQTPPTITGTPANTTVSCVEDVPQASVTSVSASDNCTGTVTVTVADVISNQTCANRYTITRTWTATDVCGNSSTSSQTITVNDQTPPLITGTPANINLNCSQDVPQGSITSVTTFENCIGAVTVTVADVISGQSCTNKYTITRTWTATDVCGNSSTSSQTITVNDSIKPIFNEQLPGDITVNCNSIPEPLILTASDNCGQATVSFNESATPGGCSGSGGIVRTWTATDACNNTTIHIQNVTVQDTTKPIITGTPEDIMVSCSEDVPVASNTSVNATDNCAGIVYITVNDVITNQICTNKYSITRTWTATDACSNSSTSSQTITVNDTIKPVFNEQLPGDITANCDAIPEPLILTANDNCGQATVTFSEVSTPGGCSGAGGIVRTWTATDACNNTTIQIQNVTVQDTTKPVISGTPEDIIVDCSTDVPEASNSSVSVTDNCTGTITVVVNDVITNQTCANKYTINRTWTATDACSNSSSVSQNITVNDTIKPIITESPRNITVGCAEDVPVANIEDVSASDNCTGTVTVTVADIVNEGNCANKFTVTRTWTATDVCGNSSTSVQTITVNDTIKPVITETPENITVSCASDVPEANNQSVEASDNCAGTVVVTVADVVTQGDCANNYTITRTWTATDVCGNSSTSAQTISVNDTIKPVILETPENITVSCESEVPEASNESVEATDNCSGAVTVSVADVVNQGSCTNKYTITRTWTATDVCGNSSTSAQTITVNDTIKPLITGTPGNITVSCASDVPEASNQSVEANDNCSGFVNVSVADVVNQGSCANKYTITRTWTATDICGNSSTASQIITVNDTIKPFIDGTPQNISVNCSEDVPEASIEVVNATDNCNRAVSVTVADVVNEGTCVNKFTITRTWTATDICGNTSSSTQTITVNDNIKPVFVEELPQSITVCVVLPDPAILTATDNCGTASVVFTETVDSSSANGVKVYTRIWTATDLCANSTSHQQWITVNPITSSYIERTVCDTLISGGVIVGGQVFTEPGLYNITVQNVFGCDSLITLNLRVSVCVPLGKDTVIYDTLPVFTTSTICELSLPPRGEVIVKSCDGETSGIETYGSWTINPQTHCLIYTAGPLEGNDTLCIIACDTARQCNTTTVIITVTGLPPIAEDDCVEEIEKNQEITIYVLENDIDPDKDQVFVQSIVTEPKHGTVTIGQEGQNIIYTPNKNYCGRDTLYYASCDGDDGCDTAMVCIYVKCDCVLPQVITPNGDGYNDHLVFPCISDGAKLIIWHRNGLIIYESDNYKNDWNGTYKGQETPGGTYFYNIEYRDEESKEMIVKQNYIMVIK